MNKRSLGALSIGVATLMLAVALLTVDRPANHVPDTSTAADTLTPTVPHPVLTEDGEDAASRREISTPISQKPALADSVRRALSTIAGQVVSEDREPLGGIDVWFIDPRDARPTFGQGGTQAWDALDDPKGGMRITYGTSTHEDGTFAWREAPPQTQWVLLIDPRGLHATSRIGVMSPGCGQRADLGVFVAASRTALTGRVVDERGAAVAGAVVRAGSAHDLLEPTSAMGVTVRRESMDAPWVQRPPRPADLTVIAAPATRTDAAGEFTLTGFTAPTQALVVSHPAFIGRVFSERDRSGSPDGPSMDLGECVLRDGETWIGQVLDTDGRPAAGVSVLAGAATWEASLSNDNAWFAYVLGGVGGGEPGGPQEAHLTQAATTDQEGHFQVTGFDGDIVLAARRPDGSGLVVESVSKHSAAGGQDGGRGGGKPFVLRLAESRRLELIPTDDDPDSEPWRLGLWAAMPESIQEAVKTTYAPPLRIDPPTRREGKRLFIDGLSAICYVLRVNAPGRAMTPFLVDLTEESAQVEIRLTREKPRSLLVVDASSGEPVDGAHVNAFVRDGGPEGFHLSDATTDADGSATLDKLPAGEMSVLVKHPAYAPVRAIFSPDAAPEVRLSRGGSLEVQLRVGTSPPARPTVISLEKEHDHELSRIVLTDGSGIALFSMVSPGPWNVRVSEMVGESSSDVMLVHSLPTVYTNLPAREVSITEGETLQIELDVLALSSDEVPTGSLMGHVLVNNAPAAGYRLIVSRHMVFGEHEITLPADGAFHFPQLPVGQTRLHIDPAGWNRGEADRWTHFAMEEVNIVADETTTLRMELKTSALRGQVLWEIGATPVRNAKVTATRTIQLSAKSFTWSKEVTRTDAAGRFVFEPALAGEWRLEAEVSGGLPAETEKFQLNPGVPVDAPPLLIRRGIPIRGRVVLPAGSQTNDPLKLTLRSGSNTARTEAPPPDFAFETCIAEPGAVTVSFTEEWGLDLNPVTIDVPATGLTEAVLTPSLKEPDVRVALSGELVLPYEGAPKVAFISHQQGSNGYGQSMNGTSFSLSVQPGQWLLSFQSLSGDRPYESIVVDVPADGVKDLVLRLTLKH